MRGCLVDAQNQLPSGQDGELHRAAQVVRGACGSSLIPRAAGEGLSLLCLMHKEVSPLA